MPVVPKNNPVQSTMVQNKPDRWFFLQEGVRKAMNTALLSERDKKQSTICANDDC